MGSLEAHTLTTPLLALQVEPGAWELVVSLPISQVGAPFQGRSSFAVCGGGGGSRSILLREWLVQPQPWAGLLVWGLDGARRRIAKAEKVSLGVWGPQFLELPAWHLTGHQE